MNSDSSVLRGWIYKSSSFINIYHSQGIPEFFENEIGEALAARTECLRNNLLKLEILSIISYIQRAWSSRYVSYGQNKSKIAYKTTWYLSLCLGDRRKVI